MKYELFIISTGISQGRVREFGDETTPDVSHKDLEWRVYVTPAPIPETEAQRRNRLKWERSAAVDAITVTTTAGNIFDGDETSQTRMARAAASLNKLTAALASGTPITLPPEVASIYRVVDGKYEMVWVLTDNTTAFISEAELSEALTLAGAAQAAIWVIT